MTSLTTPHGNSVDNHPVAPSSLWAIVLWVPLFLILHSIPGSLRVSKKKALSPERERGGSKPILLAACLARHLPLLPIPYFTALSGRQISEREQASTHSSIYFWAARHLNHSKTLACMYVAICLRPFNIIQRVICL